MSKNDDGETLDAAHNLRMLVQLNDDIDETNRSNED